MALVIFSLSLFRSRSRSRPLCFSLTLCAPCKYMFANMNMHNGDAVYYNTIGHLVKMGCLGYVLHAAKRLLFPTFYVCVHFICHHHILCRRRQAVPPRPQPLVTELGLGTAMAMVLPAPDS